MVFVGVLEVSPVEVTSIESVVDGMNVIGNAEVSASAQYE